MSTSSGNKSLTAIVGDNIRTARQAAGETQSTLAAKLGVSDFMAVSRWERGVHKPDDENLIALSRVLGQSVAWFYTDHSEQVAA